MTNVNLWSSRIALLERRGLTRREPIRSCRYNLAAS